MIADFNAEEGYKTLAMNYVKQFRYGWREVTGNPELSFFATTFNTKWIDENSN